MSEPFTQTNPRGALSRPSEPGKHPLAILIGRIDRSRWNKGSNLFVSRATSLMTKTIIASTLLQVSRGLFLSLLIVHVWLKSYRAVVLFVCYQGTESIEALSKRFRNAECECTILDENEAWTDTANSKWIIEAVSRYSNSVMEW